MRLKLITVMQTPPKEYTGPQYSESDLFKALKVGCEIETAIHKFAGVKKDLRQDKFKSLYYALNMKYTENKKKLLDGEISAEQIVNWSPNDFLNEDEKLKRQRAEEHNAAMKRGDWAREQLKKTVTDGFFKCRKCKSMKTTFN